jgi:phenylalanyl-tRNA synthetase beta chain
MNHLKEFIDTDINVLELAKLFNLHSAEVDDAYKLVDASNLVVGYVTEKTQHPDADKLSVCQVDIGGEISQIVCGAPNVDKGQYVIVSKVGAVLPGNFKIKKAKIRGIESNGMICSLAELGLDKKFVDASGIHVISEDCKPGDDPLEVLNLVDEVMSLDLTPNRGDLLSVMGVAYDAAAILNIPLTLKDVHIIECDIQNPVDVKIATENCLSYYTRVLENVHIESSPQWLQNRLIAMGIRPINNVVDITNYVMMETGQPLHAFDYDKLETGRIVVRMAKENEELVTLDEQVRVLNEQDIVITNGEKAVALGGVMGGLETEITQSTKRILLESAVFDPVHIRKTSNRLDLRSEASLRFERSVDPKRTELALERATQLFSELAGGTVLKGIQKVDHIDYTKRVIKTSAKQINDYLGLSLSKEDVKHILSRLRFDFREENEELLVTAPTRRQDITTYQDLIEEIGRIHGYDKLPLTLPKTVSKGGLTDLQKFKRSLKHRLTGLGLSEAITYSLVKEERATEFSNEDVHLTKVLMPMTQERSTLTLSPLVGLMDVLSYNKARKNFNVFLFELGKRYDEKETEVIAGALMGKQRTNLVKGLNQSLDFYDVKGLLISLFNSLYLSHLEFVPFKGYKNLHPGQSALIKNRDEVVGFIGKLHPQYEKQHDLDNVFVFELEVLKLFNSQRKVKRVKEIVKYPQIERDIAVVVEDHVTAKEILDVVKKTGKRMLLHSEVFDVYKGTPLKTNEKSVAIKLIFGDPKKTLETKDVDTRVHEILGVLHKSLNASLR